MLQDNVAREYDVFLSYAHLDADHDVANARQLAGWLESLGYSVWWDRSLIAGDDWPSELEIKVRSSKRVIVLWSPRAANSDWIKFETNIARNEGKRRDDNVLVPLIIETCATPSHWGPIHQSVVLRDRMSVRNWRTSSSSRKRA